MKKIMTLAATLAAAAAMLVASPAHAAYNSKSCDVPSGTSPVNISLSVTNNDSDNSRFEVEARVVDGGNRNWNYNLKHQGESIYSGTDDGDLLLSTTMINFLGEDSFNWRIQSANGQIACYVHINI